MKQQSLLLFRKSLLNNYYSIKQFNNQFALLLNRHQYCFPFRSSNLFLGAATVCPSGVKFCDPKKYYSREVSEDLFPLATLSVSSSKISTSAVAIMPPSNKRKTDSKDYWYSKKQKKRLQKKSLQQNSNNHEPDDESSASSGKKKKYSRSILSDKEIVDQKPHPGSYACLEMRTLYGYPEVLPDDEEVAVESNKKLPKRKVAVLIAYLGRNYGGFQINEGQRTVHAEVEYALYQSGLIALQNFGFPIKYGWATSARTDKGVHACAQLCNVKIRYAGPLAEIREKINQHLPSDIVVLDVVQTTKNFNAKTARNKVKYQYMLPSFVLQDRAKLKDLFLKHTSAAPDANGAHFSPLTSEEADKLYSIFKSYRASAKEIDNLKDALRAFEGTHCFHNYTRGRDYDDKSSSRYIISFEVQDPIISECDGMEWIPTHVTGQSFLLNQIRKMISMAIDVARQFVFKEASTDVEDRCNDIIQDSFLKKKMQIDVAPAQGLFLEMSYFDFYNLRGNVSKLDWSTADADPEAVARWKQFKEQKILPQIMKEEGLDYNFIKYLYIHDFRHSYYKYNNTPKQQKQTVDESCHEQVS